MGAAGGNTGPEWPLRGPGAARLPALPAPAGRLDDEPTRTVAVVVRGEGEGAHNIISATARVPDHTSRGGAVARTPSSPGLATALVLCASLRAAACGNISDAP